jgi:hypothetical protein
MWVIEIKKEGGLRIKQGEIDWREMGLQIATMPMMLIQLFK